MVSGSPSRRPSATRIGSTSPIRSATLVSGVASFSAYRSSRCRHSTGRSSPRSAARRFDSTVIGSNGCSPSSDPAMTGDHSSSRPTRLRSRRVLPCPRSPSSTTSWPASRARSSWGMTLPPKPCSPGHGSWPAARAASRLSRISARTDRATCPEARSSPTVVGVGRSLIASRYVTVGVCGRGRRTRLVHGASAGRAPRRWAGLLVVVAELGGLSALEPPVDVVGLRVAPLAHPVLEPGQQHDRGSGPGRPVRPRPPRSWRRGG